MEEKPRARLGDYLLGTGMGLCVTLAYLVPALVLNYNQCTATLGERELRMLLFYVTIGIAVVAALLLAVAWAASGNEKLKYSCFFVLVGLGTLLAWFVLYFSSPCLASP